MSKNFALSILILIVLLFSGCVMFTSVKTTNSVNSDGSGTLVLDMAVDVEDEPSYTSDLIEDLIKEGLKEAGVTEYDMRTYKDKDEQHYVVTHHYEDLKTALKAQLLEEKGFPFSKYEYAEPPDTNLNDVTEFSKEVEYCVDLPGTVYETNGKKVGGDACWDDSTTSKALTAKSRKLNPIISITITLFVLCVVGYAVYSKKEWRELIKKAIKI